MNSTGQFVSGLFTKAVKLVLEQLMVSVEAFWIDNQMKTKKAVGATQRLLRVQLRIEVLLERFRAGKLKWRKRAARAALRAKPAAEAGPTDAGKADTKQRKERYGLPPLFGWLAREMPNVSIVLGCDLEDSMRTDEMQGLMLATPEVARIAGPVLRMLELDDSMLLVPEGCYLPDHSNKPRRVAPAKRVDPYAYKAPFVLPEGYDEARDGRQAHPLREPDWNWRAYEDYRSYVYYYLGLKPVRSNPAPLPV